MCLRSRFSSVKSNEHRRNLQKRILGFLQVSLKCTLKTRRFLCSQKFHGTHVPYAIPVLCDVMLTCMSHIRVRESGCGYYVITLKISMARIAQSDGPPAETTEQREPLWRRAKAVVLKNFLPISLIFFLSFGILVPEPGVFFSELPTQYVCVVGIFFHSGLKLKTGELKEAFKSIKALVWGIICILLITPIVGGQLTGLLPYSVSKDHSGNSTNRTSSPDGDNFGGSSILGPALFQTGIQVYFIVPCTIAGGVILVR